MVVSKVCPPRLNRYHKQRTSHDFYCCNWDLLNCIWKMMLQEIHVQPTDWVHGCAHWLKTMQREWHLTQVESPENWFCIENTSTVCDDTWLIDLANRGLSTTVSLCHRAMGDTALSQSASVDWCLVSHCISLRENGLQTALSQRNEYGYYCFWCFAFCISRLWKQYIV